MILRKKLCLKSTKNQKNLLSVLRQQIELQKQKSPNQPLLKFSEDNIKRTDSGKVYIQIVINGEKETLVIKHSFFKVPNQLKRIEIIEIRENEIVCIIFYSKEFKTLKEDNGNYLSIDLGIKNPITTVNSVNGECLIYGREFLSQFNYYRKEIERLNKLYKKQYGKAVKTKRINKLSTKFKNKRNNFLHQTTKKLVKYCLDNNITSVVVGDIKDKKSCPFSYKQFFETLQYKLRTEGIRLIKQNEAFTSQCDPKSKEVSRKYANPAKRISRGLYYGKSGCFNADGLGAYNILRSYLDSNKIKYEIPTKGIISPNVLTITV